MTQPSTLQLGTISFARCHQRMLLPPSERVRLILAASDAYQPDLLITGGWAIQSRKHLRWLTAEIADDPRAGVIISEVQHDGRENRNQMRQHAMWAIYGAGETYRFGRQAFATSAEVSEASGASLAFLLRKLGKRTVQAGDHSVFAMLCGELNIVRGRNSPRFVDQDAAKVIMAADIVINPTHDRMSNAGTLHAKRKLLSQPHPDGRPRAYVSCSNWEACGLNGRIQQPSPTLHTVYVAGEPIGYDELADGAFGFVYRRWQLPL